MRTTLLFIHRWLGIVVGSLFAVASLTGALLVYQDDLDRLLGGPQFPASTSSVHPAMVDSALEERHRSARLIQVDWPSADAAVFRVEVEEGGQHHTHLIDAGSGRAVEQRPLHIVPRLVRRLHTSLLLGGLGSSAVRAGTIASIALIIVGVVLWWPGIRRLLRGFAIRGKRGVYVLNLDLHQVLGVAATPFLLVLVVTGALLPYPQLVPSLELPAPADQSAERDRTLRSRVNAETDRMLSTADTSVALLRVVPEGQIVSVRFPTDPDGTIEAEMDEGDGRLLVTMDQYSGAVLQRSRERARLTLNYDMVTRLHEAKVGGEPGRVVNFVACVIGFGLFPTGLVVWWMKRTRQRRTRTSAS